MSPVNVNAADTGSGGDAASVAEYTPVTLTRPASQLAIETLLLDDISFLRWIDCKGVRWPLSGGDAPIPPNEGVTVVDISISEDWKHIDQQGAHQLGVTYLDTTYDPIELELTIAVQGRTAAGRRRAFSAWKAGWDPRQTGTLVWFTRQWGNWWMDLRHKDPSRFKLPIGGQNVVELPWTVRGDFPFWKSHDSVSPVMTADVYGNLVDPNPRTALRQPSNFLPACNRGDQPGWPVHLLQGPGTFTLGDNGGPRRITLPLTAGQLARVTTQPNIQTVVEVNTNANIYKLLSGRFSTPVAPGAAVRIPVTVTGSMPGVTSAITRLTPWRSWPE